MRKIYSLFILSFVFLININDSDAQFVVQETKDFSTRDDCWPASNSYDPFFVDIYNSNIEIAWGADPDMNIDCYIIVVRLYDNLGSVNSPFPSAFFFSTLFEVSMVDAKNNAGATGFLPPNTLFVSENIGTALMQHTSSNVFIAVNILGYEGDCPAKLWDCPGGGPLQLTAASYCMDYDQTDIIARCGIRPMDTKGTAMAEYVDCMKGFECDDSESDDIDCPIASCDEGNGKFSGNPTFSTAISPNPAQDHLSLRFENPSEGPVSIQVMNHQGQIVKTILDEHYHSQGFFNIDTDIQGLAEGHYFLLINTVNGADTRRFVKAE